VGQIAGKITLRGRIISVPLGNRTPPNRSLGLQHNLSCDTVLTPGLGHKRPNEVKYDSPYAQQRPLPSKQTTIRSVQTVSDEEHFGLRDLRFSERYQRYRVVYCLCLQGTQITVAGNKVDRQCTVQRNIVARSCNHCCSGRAISITYSEFVFVALSIQHAMRMRHIVVCDLSR